MLMQTSLVRTKDGIDLVTYWDLGSSDNYINKKMAKRLKLHGSKVKIEVEGIKQQKHIKRTMLYDLPIWQGAHCAMLRPRQGNQCW